MPMEHDNFTLPSMPIDELEMALQEEDRAGLRLASMLLLRYDPRRFFLALAAANVGRGVYRHVDR